MFPWQIPDCSTEDATFQALESLDLSLNPRSLTHLGVLWKLSFSLPSGHGVNISPHLPELRRSDETMLVRCLACNQYQVLGEIFSFVSLISQNTSRCHSSKHLWTPADVVMVAKIMGFECSQSELGHLLSIGKLINLCTH